MTHAGDITDDAILGGALKLLQPGRGHRAGTDAVLVAALVPVQAGQHVVDLGSGVGTAGLAVLAREPTARVTLVEISAVLSDLGRENAVRNGFAGHSTILCGDVEAIGRPGFHTELADSADHVVMNPPFNDEAGRVSSDPTTAQAHSAPPGMFDLWVRSAVRILKPGGTLSLVHRAEALADLLPALTPRFGDLALRFVHPRADAAAVRVLILGRKGRRGPLHIAPPLVLNGEDGFTPEAAALHASPAALLL